MRRRENNLPGAIALAGADKDPQFVTALARGLLVLRAFHRGDPPLGNQELARRTKLPKPTISRLTYTLSHLGYLQYVPDVAKYTLSVEALALGFSALGSLAIRDVARPYMQALANETGVSVALGARSGMSMVYLEHCRGDSPLHIGIDVGSHISLASSAMGRAYLLGLSPEDREEVVTQLRQRDSWARVRHLVEEILARESGDGLVLSIGDWKPEVNAVGVPLVIGGGSLTFALNCGGPASLLSKAYLVSTVGPELAKVAAAVRAKLGLNL